MMITLFVNKENKDAGPCRCSRILHPSFLISNDRESIELSLKGGGEKLVIVEQKNFLI